MNPRLSQRSTASREFGAQFGSHSAAINNLSGHGTRFRLLEGPTLEHVRREVRLGRQFTPAEFERAFSKFRQMYQVRPVRVLCSPDVLERFCALFERSVDVAHSREIRYEGIPLCAAILSPGMVAFEGDVDEERMGDW
ncbi:MAG: hypothetical protein NVSMB31_01640 [Vulcanimicrobiaceae bacterium]